MTGIAANTEAGVALVESLCGVRALDLTEPAASVGLMTLLREKLWGGPRPAISAWVVWTGI